MNLDELKNKLAQELDLADDELEDDSEEDEDEEEKRGPDEIDAPKKKGLYSARRAVEYRSTARKTRGKVFYMYYDIDYKDLADYMTQEVSGVTWTIQKARRVFRAIRKYIGFSDPRRDKKSSNK
jgi:hypothetical protein